MGGHTLDFSAGGATHFWGRFPWRTINPTWPWAHRNPTIPLIFSLLLLLFEGCNGCFHAFVWLFFPTTPPPPTRKQKCGGFDGLSSLTLECREQGYCFWPGSIYLRIPAMRNYRNPRGKYQTHVLNQTYHQALLVTHLQHLGIPVQSLLKPFSFPRIHLSDSHYGITSSCSFGGLLEVEIGVVGSDFCRFASFPPSSSEGPTSGSK